MIQGQDQSWSWLDNSVLSSLFSFFFHSFLSTGLILICTKHMSFHTTLDAKKCLLKVSHHSLDACYDNS